MKRCFNDIIIFRFNIILTVLIVSVVTYSVFFFLNINKVEKPFLIAQLTPIAKPNSFSFKQDGETVSYREKKAAITVKQGDTLGGSLGKLRVENEDIFAISRSFKEVF